MDKEVKVIFEGEAQTNYTYEEAIEKVKKSVYEEAKKYKFVSADEVKYGCYPEERIDKDEVK